MATEYLYMHRVPAVTKKCIGFLTCKPSNECLHSDGKKRSRKLRLMQRRNDYFAPSKRCVSQSSLDQSQVWACWVPPAPWYHNTNLQLQNSSSLKAEYKQLIL